MAGRRKRGEPSDLDQPLPWEEEADPAACTSASTPPASEPASIPTPAVVADNSRPSLSRASEPKPRARRTKGLTPEQRALRSRLAAYRLHATHDPKAATKKAREAFAARFEREVDPAGVLSSEERARRAEAARRAYFTGLALRSSRARRRVG